VSPAAISFDGVYPEAALLSRLGNDAEAIAWLDPALQALPATGPLALANPAAAGTFVRAMALRAELAARVGDSVTARRWARAVEILWSNADEFLQPVVTRARTLSR
jgi:hypothetical protein